MAVRLCLLVTSETTPIKLHQHDGLTRAEKDTSIDILKWIRKGHKASALQRELQATKEC